MDTMRGVHRWLAGDVVHREQAEKVAGTWALEERLIGLLLLLFLMTLWACLLLTPIIALVIFHAKAKCKRQAIELLALDHWKPTQFIQARKLRKYLGAMAGPMHDLEMKDLFNRLNSRLGLTVK